MHEYAVQQLAICLVMSTACGQVMALLHLLAYCVSEVHDQLAIAMLLDC